MTKVEEARIILAGLGLPSPQCNEISAYTLLALCGIRPQDSWSSVSRKSLTISKGVMAFIKQEYGKTYAPNTRETVRRQVLHQFVQARVADYNPDNPSLSTNSSRSHYALSESALVVVRRFGKKDWKTVCTQFQAKHGSLLQIYRNERSHLLVPVRLSSGKVLELSPGRHNEVQAAVVTQFAARFAPDSVLTYLGDTANKILYVDRDILSQLAVPISVHDKLPDVVLYDAERQWLFLVEAVTSHGPMTPKRLFELKQLFTKCNVGIVFVSAFPDLTEFRKHLKNIAWETEVWIAEIPDHLIHFNGDRFLGPH